MANPAIESLKYNYVVIESPNGRKVDITNSVIFTDYFEDILSPFVTMSEGNEYNIFGSDVAN